MLYGKFSSERITSSLFLAKENAVDQAEINSRLMKVLERTAQAKSEAERLSNDKDKAAEDARQAAQRDMPQIVKSIEANAASSGGQHVITSVIIHIRVPSDLGVGAWRAYICEYYDTVVQMLPAGFDTHSEGLHFQYPHTACFTISW